MKSLFDSAKSIADELESFTSIYAELWITLLFVWFCWITRNYLLSLSERAKLKKGEISINEVDETVQRHLKWMREGNLEEGYLNRLDNLLSAISNWLGDADTIKKNRSIRFLRTPNTWTSQSYNFSLLLSLIYPIMAFIASWSVGGVGTIGSVYILPEQTTFLTRTIILLILAFMPYGFWRAFRSESLRAGIKWFILVVIAGSIADALFSSGAFSVITTSIIAICFSLTLIQKKNCLGSVAITAIGSFNLFYPITGAGIIAILGPAYLKIVPLCSMVVSFVLVIICVKAWIVLLSKSKQKLWLYVIHWLVYSFACICILGAIKQDNISRFVFLTILPLVNAPLDWFSLGLTRSLLQAISNREHKGLWPALWATLDSITAIILFFLIAGFSTLGIRVLNEAFIFSGKEPIINLSQLFSGIQASPLSAEYLWIWIILGSTLIPTLVHAAIASTSICLLYPKRWRRIHARKWYRDSDSFWFFNFYVSILPGVALLFPLFLIGALIKLFELNHGILGIWLLNFCYWIAGIPMP